MRPRARKIPYGQITRAAGHHADAVMNAMPRGRRYFMKHREHWAVAFEAFKRGARWMARGGK